MLIMGNVLDCICMLIYRQIYAKLALIIHYSLSNDMDSVNDHFVIILNINLT